MTEIPRIIIIGSPGSGKSTQAVLLAERLHAPYLSTGDLLRYIAAQNTTFGQEIKTYLDRGEIVPDDLTVQLIEDIVSKEEYRNGYVGEGFPRTIKQAVAMNQLIDWVIYISIDDSTIINRLMSRLICPKCDAGYNILTQPPKVQGVCDQCGTKLVSRSDDNHEVIHNRIKVYHQITEPVIAYFKSENKLKVVNGEQPIDAVSKDIIGFVDTLRKDDE